VAGDKILRNGPSVGMAPITVRIPQAAQMLGVGRTTIYTLINSGEIEIIKIGSATVIVVDSLRAYVTRRQLGQ
jgi:excisionase family DNA binding protein